MRHVDTPASRCRFGIARGDITPPVGIYHRMWGAATHEQSTGVHRPLLATAMALGPLASEGRQPPGQIILVAIDHCLFFGKEMDQFRETAAREGGVHVEQVLVAFSHTHGSGLMDTGRAKLPGGDKIAPYLEETALRVGKLVKTARDSMQEATITYGSGQCGLATHRDFWDEQTKQFVCGFNPGGPVDGTVLVGRVTGVNGKTLATLVNYACHPTTLAWQNKLISPDYIGALREVVERDVAGPCVFLQGASGDIGPREGFVGDPAVADRNGRQLAHAVLAVLEGLPPPGTRFQYAGPVVSGATLGTWQHVPLPRERLEEMARWEVKRWTLDLPYRTDLPSLEQTKQERERWLAQEVAAQKAGDEVKARDCHAMVERADRRITRFALLPAGKTFPFPITLWRMGDACWLALEAEHYNVLQRELREKCGAMPLIVMTLVNGSRPFYLPPVASYGKGIYQETVAALAAGSLEKVIESVGKELAR